MDVVCTKVVWVEMERHESLWLARKRSMREKWSRKMMLLANHVPVTVVKYILSSLSFYR